MYSLLDIIRRYFISPIWERSGYNWVNTLVYGAILGIAAVVTYKSIKKTGYRFKFDLFLMFLPFLVLATSIRVLVDAGKYPYTYLLISPGIYITTMAIFAGSLLLALAVRRLSGVEVKQTVITVGIVLATSQLLPLLGMVERPVAGMAMGALSAGICGFLAFLHLQWGERLPVLWNRENVAALGCHLVDATVTFIGIDFYDYAEQHVLPRTLIDISGTAAAMYLMKLLALPLVLYLLDEHVEEREMRLFIKMVIMVIGLAPATRNFLRIVIGS